MYRVQIPLGIFNRKLIRFSTRYDYQPITIAVSFYYIQTIFLCLKKSMLEHTVIRNKKT